MLSAASVVLLLLFASAAIFDAAAATDPRWPPRHPHVGPGDGRRGARRHMLPRRQEPSGDGFLRAPMRTKSIDEATTGGTHGLLPKRWSYSGIGGPAALGKRETNLREYRGLIYLIDLKIGSPAQTVSVIVDTGSYELWVSPNCTRSVDQQLCRRTGAYHPRQSSTADHIGGRRHLVYGTGEALGEYWLDTIGAAAGVGGGLQVPLVQFIVANDSNYAFAGVLGMGYTYPWTTPYPYTLLQMMWAYGLIKAPIFSLALGGTGGGESEIIFGGVNLYKYRGRLEPVRVWPPIEKQDPSWLQYSVNVTSFGITQPGDTRSDPLIDLAPARGDPLTKTTTMIIDSGSTLSYGPPSLVHAIAARFNSTRVDGAGNFWVDCAHRDQRGSIDFGFNDGNLTVSVKYSDFIWMQYPGGCLLGMQPADAGSTDYVLGATFLRGAYLVFDQETDIVWMGSYRNCGDGVVPVGVEYADAQSKVGRC
ncbi:hypothetical protein MAPG_06098 [Magnaporthiopsis poae ATCC 64411]|uniref:Peptidase A1 domain-containing protein n=1 Tax=Magnaporthiopsis poae (strain ATCC 64411 / 73-15) TaxID=644358 RepID=A0A0C4E150_MAGP6|nr:hypothetical protein MAPG_06098 [Magnaporthiopsis poae ATCC 64411]